MTTPMPQGDTNHTPGPWLLNADAERQEPGFYRTPHKSGKEKVYTSIHIGDSARLASFIRPADARLIAAAPELLEALKHLVAYIEREGPAAMEWRAISEWATKGQAAIAKAEGK